MIKNVITPIKFINKIVNFLIFIIVFGAINLSFSQTENHIETALKINTSMLAKFYEEVYRNSEYTLNSEREGVIKLQIDRIIFIKIPFVENETYKLLSTVIKMDKYNPTLNYDTSIFDTNTFNPLKYNFNYYLKRNQFFRIDDTEYVIMINSMK